MTGDDMGGLAVIILVLVGLGCGVGWFIWGRDEKVPLTPLVTSAPVKSPYTAREDFEYCLKYEFDKQYCYKTHITKEK